MEGRRDGWSRGFISIPKKEVSRGRIRIDVRGNAVFTHIDFFGPETWKAQRCFAKTTQTVGKLNRCG